MKPVHPPFTHFPLAAYVFAAAFDIASAAGSGHRWAGQLWHAGTFVLIGGLVVCLATMGTGFRDLVRFWPREPADPAPGAPDPLKTVAAHVSVMAGAFMIGAGDVAWRLSDYDSRASTPPGVVALSLTAAIVACTGGFLGGKLVFRYAMGVAPAALAANMRLPAGPAPDDHEHAAAGSQPPGTDAPARAASDGHTDVTGRPAGPYQEAGWDGRGATRGDTAP
jgi:uncharacterized membrane protein